MTICEEHGWGNMCDEGDGCYSYNNRQCPESQCENFFCENHYEKRTRECDVCSNLAKAEV